MHHPGGVAGIAQFAVEVREREAEVREHHRLLQAGFANEHERFEEYRQLRVDRGNGDVEFGDDGGLGRLAPYLGCVVGVPVRASLHPNALCHRRNAARSLAQWHLLGEARRRPGRTSIPADPSANRVVELLFLRCPDDLERVSRSHRLGIGYFDLSGARHVRREGAEPCQHPSRKSSLRCCQARFRIEERQELSCVRAIKDSGSEI